MSIVYLGNINPLVHASVDDVASIGTNEITRIDFKRDPGSSSIDLISDGAANTKESRERRERLVAVVQRSAADRPYFLHLEDLRDLWWDKHSGEGASWVESDDTGLAEAISRYFSCQIGRPAEWSGPQTHPHDEAPALAGADPVPAEPQLAELMDVVPLWRSHEHNPFCGEFSKDFRMLMTNAGQDAFFAQHINTGAQPAAFTYGALSADTTTESTASTTLTSEITTAGGGLLRKQMTYAHTTATNTGTLTATWTANGSDALPVTIARIGILNAASAGTLGYDKKFTTTAVLSASGDALTVTFTLTRS